MAGRGLLAKILRSPELMLALGLGGAGAMSADEDQDPLVRALGGAALGAAGGAGLRGGARAVKGLLGRVPVNIPTQQDKIAQAMAMRRAMGFKGSQASQFPSGQAMTEAEKFADMIAMEKYGDKIGQTGIDRAIDGMNDVGRLTDAVAEGVAGTTSRVWDAANNTANRMLPTDTLARAKSFLGKHPVSTYLGGVAAAGAGGLAIIDALKDQETQEEAMKALGFDLTPTGVKMFQAQSGVPLTGRMDDATIAAIAKALSESAESDEEYVPPAPSLAPHNRR